MEPSRACFDLIKRFEGCRLTAYQDVVGVWTIGYGHTEGVGPRDRITVAMAEAWLYGDVRGYGWGVAHLVKVPLAQCQFDALVSFVFNLGVHALQTSTLLQKLNAGDFQGAAAEFIRWDHAGGVELAGLKARRIAECALFKETDGHPSTD